MAAVLLVAWAVGARASDGAQPEQIYVVQAHDTLWTISGRFFHGDPREGVWKLQHRNHLAGTLIVPGQRLRVPAR